jgi:glycosyltransferase involved in cell wall biosynthesis
MMASGLPVITSLGSEISFLINERGTGLGFNIGDWQQLAQKILVLARDPELSSRMATAAFRLTHNELSFQNTTSFFRDWVKCPTFAPDRSKRSYKERLANLTHKMRSYTRIEIWRAAGLDK